MSPEDFPPWGGWVGKGSTQPSWDWKLGQSLAICESVNDFSMIYVELLLRS